MIFLFVCALYFFCCMGLRKTCTGESNSIFSFPPFLTYSQWTVITVPRNRFCWSVMVQVKDKTEAKEQRFMNSEWGPEANEKLIEIVRDFPVTFGGKLGEIIDSTPKNGISKVMLEEKLFETWYHGGIVLIGDGEWKEVRE